MTEPPDPFQLQCPLPISGHETVQLAHGGGGRLMRKLLEEMVLPQFRGDQAEFTPPHDSAVFELGNVKVAFTTDSFVVSPLFFPGGDIGELAVYGTVNDLAMAGARPLYLSCGLIVEEGTPMEVLRRIVASMQRAASQVPVAVVTGDTKVVDRGKGDGVYINTAGVGLVMDGAEISPSRVRPGDRVLVSGDLGRHGVAILSVREGLEFEGAPESDCGSLWKLVEELLSAGVAVHCLRDLTRGGLGAALIEIAEDAGLRIRLREEAIPVGGAVRTACELLGLDPLFVANEGRLAAFVPESSASRALAILKRHAPADGPGPAVVGTVEESSRGLVEVHNAFGAARLLDLPSGEQMPRIC